MRAVPGSPLWLRCAALLVLAAGLFAPPVTTERKVFDVLAVLDITGSMNVRDQRLDGAEASRLAMEKRAVRHLLAALPCGSRLGVAIFVEKQPFLLFEPVETCGNFSALDEEIAAIDWRMGWDSESHIAEAVLAAMKIAGGLDAFLVFMTDGQETPPLWWSGGGPSFAAARGSAHGLIVGVGGYQLVPIPKFDGYGREIGVFKPGDEPHLRALASSSGLTYLHLDGPDAILPALTSFARPRQFPQKHSITWMFALASLALLAGAYGFGLSGRLGPDS